MYLLGFLVAIVTVALIIGIVHWFIAMIDGRDDGYRTVTRKYDNTYMMPWALAYDIGYRQTEEGSDHNIKEKNKKRFNRE